VQVIGSRFLFAAMVKVLRMGRLVDRKGERDWGVDRATSNRTMRTVIIADSALSFGPAPLSAPLLLVFCFHRDLHNAVLSPFRGHNFQQGPMRPAWSKRLHHLTTVQDKHNRLQHNVYSTTPLATEASFLITSILTIFVEKLLRPYIPPAYRISVDVTPFTFQHSDTVRMSREVSLSVG
jgi:hypothetical protein